MISPTSFHSMARKIKLAVTGTGVETSPLSSSGVLTNLESIAIREDNDGRIPSSNTNKSP